VSRLTEVEKNSRLVTLMGDFESSWVNGEACLNNYKHKGKCPSNRRPAGQEEFQQSEQRPDSPNRAG